MVWVHKIRRSVHPLELQIKSNFFFRFYFFIIYLIFTFLLIVFFHRVHYIKISVIWGKVMLVC